MCMTHASTNRPRAQPGTGNNRALPISHYWDCIGHTHKQCLGTTSLPAVSHLRPQCAARPSTDATNTGATGTQYSHPPGKRWGGNRLACPRRIWFGMSLWISPSKIGSPMCRPDTIANGDPVERCMYFRNTRARGTPGMCGPHPWTIAHMHGWPLE